MRGTVIRTWSVGLVVMLVALAIGAGGGPAQEETPPGHHPAHIHAGSCAQLDPNPAFSLTELAMDLGAMDQGPAIPVLTTATTIDAKLADLLASPYALDVHELRELAMEDTGPLACGDIGGQPAGDVLTIGVRELSDSGLSGIAVLQAAGDQTIVTLYLAHGLAGEAQGETAQEATTAQVTFYVPTIGCPGCQFRVDASVRKAPGILDVSFDGQTVTVTYDPRAVTPEEIEAAIEAGGDTVEPVEA